MFTRPAKPRKPSRPKALIAGAALAALASSLAFGAVAGPVGQTWRTFPDPSAASRDYLGRAQVRAVVWYPAAGGAAEKPIVIGPPGAETFSGGVAAPDAPVACGRKLPLIVMSHGAGGTALQYGWLGDALARRGYVVVAVDHPGASGGERATDAGAKDWWKRADDITAAIDGALSDPIIGPRIDERRIGMVGYSLGGATGLLLAGAKPSLQNLTATTDPSMLYADFMARVNQIGGERDTRIAAFALIAPAVLPFFDLSAGLPAKPMLVVAGEGDVTVKPADNAARLAKVVTGTRLEMLPGVGHNDFLQPCTDLGRTRYADLCKEPNAQRAATHAKAAELIGGFFDGTLRK